MKHCGWPTRCTEAPSTYEAGLWMCEHHGVEWGLLQKRHQRDRDLRALQGTAS